MIRAEVRGAWRIVVLRWEPFTFRAVFSIQYLFASVWVRRTLYINAACSGLCPVAHVDSKASTTPSPHEDAVGWCVRLRLPIGWEMILYNRSRRGTVSLLFRSPLDKRHTRSRRKSQPLTTVLLSRCTSERAGSPSRSRGRAVSPRGCPCSDLGRRPSRAGGLGSLLTIADTDAASCARRIAESFPPLPFLSADSCVSVYLGASV